MTTGTASEFVEGFALELNQSGMQRMAARVFAALLVAPENGYTAKEIGDALGVSAAAVSGATAYLTRMGLAVRRRVAGERVDRYNVLGTTWAEVMAAETKTITALAALLEEGMEQVDTGSAAHERLAATRDFFTYMAVEMPKLVDRWHESRKP
ncbi:GbsR/MarR family transcriptional regulator [Aeromicrobium sp. 9AM]|uniref:GbsR/MarR family transcriptional regulator n=1 Tax=Aeromicrobium sp. 9AM TaxID=2653126 RepID=UPI0013591E67|nr:helix-turn-helix domain-containing protein [Aeromicrobium sp. 9AM]